MKEYVRNIFKNLAKDDPFCGIDIEEFLSLMQSLEMEIVGMVTNYAAAHGINQNDAVDAAYHVMLGYFFDDFSNTDVFIVVDALGLDADGMVRRNRYLQFVYCILWKAWCEDVRLSAREMIKVLKNDTA